LAMINLRVWANDKSAPGSPDARVASS
jgi:hypothetical protein